MANLGLINKNAGNLKDPSTGNFRTFASDQEGVDALRSDIEFKKSGNSPHIKPGGTILDFAKVWAPASDNNVPSDWANNVAKTIGKKPTDSWSDISTDDLIKGIRVAEGTSTPNRVLSSTASAPAAKEIDGNLIKQNVIKLQEAGATSEDIETYVKGAVQEGQNEPSEPSYFKDIADIQSSTKTQPNVAQSVTGANPDDSKYGQVIDNKLTRGLINVVPGAKDLGEGIGSSLAYFGEKAKGLLGGQDNSKYVDKADIGKTALGAAKAMGTAATIASMGIGLNRILQGSKAISSPVIENVMAKFRMPVSEFKALSNAEKLNALTEGLKNASASERLVLQKAIQEIEPAAMKELGLTPSLFKKAIGRVGSLAAKTSKGLIGAGVAGALGGTAKGIYDHFVR